MKTETIKTLDLRYLIDEVVSKEELRGILTRQLGMGQLFDILTRVAAHVYPEARCSSGGIMTYDFLIVPTDAYDNPIDGDNTEFTTDTGHPVGLTIGEMLSGIGTIDIDGDYDTAYTTYAKDIDWQFGKERNAIYNALHTREGDEYAAEQLVLWLCKNALSEAEINDILYEFDLEVE